MRQMLLLACLVALPIGTSGCQFPWKILVSPTTGGEALDARLAPTAPEPGPVVVLSPISHDWASKLLTLDAVDSEDVAPGSLWSVAQTASYNFAASVAERWLIERGWRVHSQAVLARNLRDFDHNRAAWLLGESKEPSLLEAALFALADETAPGQVLLIRSLEMYYDAPVHAPKDERDRVVHGVNVGVLHVEVDGVVVSVKDGSIQWTGHAVVRGTDLLESPAVIELEPDGWRSSAAGLITLGAGPDEPSFSAGHTRQRRMVIERAIHILLAAYANSDE